MVWIRIVFLNVVSLSLIVLGYYAFRTNVRGRIFRYLVQGIDLDEKRLAGGRIALRIVGVIGIVMGLPGWVYSVYEMLRLLHVGPFGWQAAGVFPSSIFTA